MKLFIVNNNCDTHKVIKYIGKAVEIIKSKLPLNFDYQFEFVNEPIEYELFYISEGKEYWGLKKYTTNKFTTNAKGCAAVVYFYTPNKVDLYNWTIGEERLQIQIAYQEHDKMPEIIAHELTHSLFSNLRKKEIYLTDNLDKDNKGLQSILDALDEIKPYSEYLEKELPIDKKISILEQIKLTLETTMLYLQGLRRLDNLLLAMATFEGFYVVGSRAWRNKNPLNIKWLNQVLAIGKDADEFCIFRNEQDGFETARKDIASKIKGFTNTELNGESSIEDLIKTWSETDQMQYTDFVCEKLKIKKDFKIKNFIV